MKGAFLLREGWTRNMSDAQLECETIINFNEEEAVASVYTPVNGLPPCWSAGG